jgi:hypothetical protein
LPLNLPAQLYLRFDHRDAAAFEMPLHDCASDFLVRLSAPREWCFSETAAAGLLFCVSMHMMCAKSSPYEASNRPSQGRRDPYVPRGAREPNEHVVESGELQVKIAHLLKWTYAIADGAATQQCNDLHRPA